LWKKPFDKKVFSTPLSKNFYQNFSGKVMDRYASMCSCRFMGDFSLNPQARNEVARSKKSWGYSVGDGKQNDVSPSGDMMFRLRSNDVAPTGRNDVPFVRDKRYFNSVGEGFPLPPTFHPITVCSLSVGDGASGFRRRRLFYRFSLLIPIRAPLQI